MIKIQSVICGTICRDAVITTNDKGISNLEFSLRVGLASQSDANASVIIPVVVNGGKREDLKDYIRGNRIVMEGNLVVYKAKKCGNGLTEMDLGFYTVSPIPKGLTPIVIDNVIGSGLTGKAAIHALGKGTVLALAMDDKFYADYLRNDSKQMAVDYETKQDTQYCHVYHH